MNDPGAGATAGTPSRCPRCGGRFECGAAAPGPCACAAVALSAPLQARLRDLYTGCLCLHCLHDLAAAERGHATQPGAAP